MSVASATVSLFRNLWADRFVDTCVVKEETGTSYNDTTKQDEPTYTTRYSGACLVRDVSARDVDLGEQQTEIRRYRVFVPYDTTGLAPKMLVDVTSTNDGDLNGLQLVVRSVGKDTYNTVRILECEEDQSD